MSLADDNNKQAYEMIVDYTDGENYIWDADDETEPDEWVLAYTHPGLGLYNIFTKDASDESNKALQSAMDTFTCSFEFEAKKLFIDNRFGYEITLPRIIID